MDSVICVLVYQKKPHRAGVDDALRAPLKLYAKGKNRKCRMIRKRITYMYMKKSLNMGNIMQLNLKFWEWGLGFSISISHLNITSCDF